MTRTLLRFCFALLVLAPFSASAQLPEASPEHKIVQRDVGRWEATVKVWMGADGKGDPNATPQVSQGTEVNRKLGAFWVIGTFKGEFGGTPFEGHSLNGFDSKKKQFIGTWIDSMTPTTMQMVGTYDEKTSTLTSTTKGIGMDGQEAIGKIVVKHEGRDSRVMTMYDVVDGKDVKSMEITYKRVKQAP